MAVVATCVVGKPGGVKTHVRDAKDGCQRLQQAGLALYDDLIEIYPSDFIDIVQTSYMSPVDLLDRDDVADFLCSLADVECIEDLAFLLNMPEPMVRQYYNTMRMQIRTFFDPAPGQDLFQEIFLVWDILVDIVAFADQVGYTGSATLGVEQSGQAGDNRSDEIGQGGQYGQHGQYRQSGAQPNVHVDFFVALDFSEGMEEKYGEDWENVLARLISMRDSFALDDVDIDPITLAAAIAFSANEMEFATNTELPIIVPMYMANIISGLQMTMIPGSGLTALDVYGKAVDAAKVAYNLGLFSLN